MSHDIFENWAESKEVLLEGLNPQMRETVGVLLDNQKTQMVSENAAGGSTSATDIAGFRKIMIPMIRRIIPGTIASELVGVQPMQGPVGLVYSLRYKYAEEATGVDFAGNPTTINAGSEAFGNTHNPGDSNPIYAFYSGGRGTLPGEIGRFAPTAGEAAGASGIGPGSPGDIPAADANGGAFGAATGFSALDGCTTGGSGGAIEGSGGRKMTMEVVSQAVEAGSRKLQAGWTIEAMQDLNSQHGLDIENEMTQALSAQVTQEIDQEIISDLIALAGTAAAYDGSLPGAPGYYTPAYVGDRLANLSVMINYICNEIGRKTRRGAGNFIVVSPMIVSVLQSASKSVFAPSTEGSFKGPSILPSYLVLVLAVPVVDQQ